MDLRKIEYFIQVAEHRSFSRAAQSIHISQQALSKQIRVLECELNTNLFKRTTSKVELTGTGKILYDTFSPIVRTTHEAYSLVEKEISALNHRLEIEFYNALSYSAIVDPIVSRLRTSQAELALNISATGLEEGRKNLDCGAIDLLITLMDDPSLWEDYAIRVIDLYPLKIIVSHRHPWYEKERPVSAEEFGQERLLIYETEPARFLSRLNCLEHIWTKNYDSYINRLSEGREIGVIADIYSPREGCFRLLDLPREYQSCVNVIAAYRYDHPLRKLFETLQ